MCKRKYMYREMKLLLLEWLYAETAHVLLTSGARFSKAPETFWARKAIFSSSVAKYVEVYTS